jgi:hypothetical protein
VHIDLLLARSKESIIRQIEAALGETLLFTSFEPGSWDGSPTWSAVRERLNKVPAVYAITYMREPPASHPELVAASGTALGARFLYVGQAQNAWTRFKTHRTTLEARCWPDGPELDAFWFFAMPVAKEWMLKSVEDVAIEYLRPPFNLTLPGLGRGGSSAFDLYMQDPKRLSGADQKTRVAIAERVKDVLYREQTKPRYVLFDGPHESVPPHVKQWLDEEDRST